ncbi:MAG: hypothetical protein AB7P31_05610 [Steroidobacteraceae bacterium]
MSRKPTKFAEIDAAAERATLRRERMQLIDRLGPAAGLVSAAIASGARGDWVDARSQLERVEKILQVVLDEAADRVLVDDASQERAEYFARKEEAEERFED